VKEMARLKNNLKPLLMKHYNVTEVKDLPSQQDIAKFLGVSQTTVSRWLAEKIDRFDADILENMCRTLKCNVGDLIFFDEKELYRQ
jgi:DNA-binding Xre family transcriptional regulator